METKKTKILSIVALVVLAIAIIGASFAYFQAQVGNPAEVDISVNANTVDTFTFATGSAIGLNLNQDNFGNGAGNLTKTTTASAKLSANNKTNTVTEHYYMYLNIESNTFTYSIGTSSPEIILTVTDASGNAVEISGLTSVTAGGVSGYDITNKTGLITLLNNREITTTSSIEEKWNITITFINYDENQSSNAGKSMSAKVILQKDEYKVYLADYIKDLYTTQGANGLYHHDGSLTNGISDGSYRYAGASDSVNNYVCFGSTATTCPDDNLYRIIGVFGDQVKLIKATSVGNKVWDSSKNIWSTSSLNTYLNGDYLTGLTTTWSNKIANTTWKVAGNTYANIRDVVASVAYTNEITSPNKGSFGTEDTYSAKIGLMYVSDYGFAADPSAWTTTLYNNDGSVNGSTITSLNWMYLGSYEWAISRSADDSDGAFGVDSDGYVFNGGVYNVDAVRPVFYLTSSITYVRGDGTASSPYVIN